MQCESWEENITTLLETLIEQEHDGKKLFITMEQGSGLANNNVKVILNPRMKCNARKWLIESYPKIAFQCLSTKNTSVDSQEF